MSDVNDLKTIEDLSETELEELIAAGRLSDDGEILPAEGDEGGEAVVEEVTEVEGGDTGEEVEGEGEGSEAEADPKPEDKTPDVKQTGDAVDQVRDEDAEGVMIPKARLDQEANRRRKLEEERAAMERELAFLKGKDAAHKERSEPKPDEAGTQPKKTVEQLEGEIDQIWEKADTGDLTLKEARRLERELQAEIQVLTQPKPSENKSEPDTGYRMIAEREVNREAQRIATEYPYIGVMSEADMAYCSAKVDEQIRAEGIKMPRNEIDATIARMELIGKMTTKLGPGLTGKDLSPKPADKTPTTLTEDQKRQAAKAKAEERSEKIKTAAQQPPNSSATGTASGGFGDMTPDRFENLSESEREALPAAVLDRLTNG